MNVLELAALRSCEGRIWMSRGAGVPKPKRLFSMRLSPLKILTLAVFVVQLGSQDRAAPKERRGRSAYLRPTSFLVAARKGSGLKSIRVLVNEAR